MTSSQIIKISNKTINYINNLKNKKKIEIRFWFDEFWRLENNYSKNDEFTKHKYFKAKSCIVFSYACIEKFLKEVSVKLLRYIVKTEIYIDNTSIEELLYFLNNRNPINILDIHLKYKQNSNINLETLGYRKSKDLEYFGSLSSINSKNISIIINSLNLNKHDENIYIPKVSIDTISQFRHIFAHGDDLKEFNKFIKNKNSEAILDDFCTKNLRLTEFTLFEVLKFIESFSVNSINLIEYIKKHSKV